MARKPKVSLSLTPAAVAVLDDLAQQIDSSRSALVEQLLQGKIALQTPLGEWTVRLGATEAGATVAAVAPGQGAAIAADVPVAVAPEPKTAIAANVPAGSPASSAPAAGDPAFTPEVPAGDTDAPPAAAIAPNSPDPTAELTALRQQIVDLEAQLAAAPAEPPAVQATPAADTAELTALRQQIADLEAQLAAASAEPPAVQATPAADTAELTALRQQIAELQAQPQLPVPHPDPVPALQRQLLEAISAQSVLQTQVQTQAQELAQLRQTLAQQQSLAAIGEHQLNRWQHQAYAH